jgi:hypothetical protein
MLLFSSSDITLLVIRCMPPCNATRGHWLVVDADGAIGACFLRLTVALCTSISQAIMSKVGFEIIHIRAQIATAALEIRIISFMHELYI